MVFSKMQVLFGKKIRPKGLLFILVIPAGVSSLSFFLVIPAGVSSLRSLFAFGERTLGSPPTKIVRIKIRPKGLLFILVIPAGVEPAIFWMRTRRPRPLDDGTE